MSLQGPSDAYEFGGFRFEPAALRLVYAGREIPITAKTADMLRVLVEHRGAVVTKDDLMAQVWPGTAVEENNLNQQISALRKALAVAGDAAKIETVPRRGYRLVVGTQNVAPADVVAPAFGEPVASPGEQPDRQTPVALRAGSRMRSWMTGVIVLVLLLVAAQASMSGWRMYNAWSKSNDSRAAVTKADEYLRQDNAKAAIAEYQHAVSLDPANANVYAGMAHALNKAGSGGLRFVSRDTPSPSVEAARRSVEADPNCGPCHGTLGFYLFYHQWQFAEAETRFREALRLAPGREDILPPIAMLYSVTGRTDEALKLMDTALEKRPFVLNWVVIRSSILYLGRRYDDAIAAADRAIQIDPAEVSGWTWRSNALFQLGRGEEAVRALVRSILPEHTEAIETALRRDGADGGLRALLAASEAEPYRTRFSWRRASWLVRLKDVDRALDELELACSTRNLNAIYLAADPVVPRRPRTPAVQGNAKDPESRRRRGRALGPSSRHIYVCMICLDDHAHHRPAGSRPSGGSQETGGQHRPYAHGRP